MNQEPVFNLFDPVRWAKAVARETWGVALVSGQTERAHSRYSLFAIEPTAIFACTGDQWSLSGDWRGKRPTADLPPMLAWRVLLNESMNTQPTADDASSAAIFQGGWIGYFGYELGSQFERLPSRHPRRGAMPDACFAYYDAFALHDQTTGVLTFAREESADDCKLDRLRGVLLAGEIEEAATGPLITGPLTSDTSEEDFCKSVQRALDYLAAGDIFQVNVSQEISGRWASRQEVLVGRALASSPAPFSAVLRGDDWTIVSTSPERFLLATPSGRVETRPIKGTRQRGRGPEHDMLLREDLLNSVKDAAELTMIVDLERNDLGRVCQYGSIRVAEHRAIESYVNVHHAVSTVEGRLAPGKDLVDLIAATFPGGSITGAPKIRAMQIIDELERGRRGVYTGAIGYISRHGRMDLNVAIRTLVVEGDRVSYRVGGGIVIESDPLAEYRETLDKGRRLRAVLMGED